MGFLPGIAVVACVLATPQAEAGAGPVVKAGIEVGAVFIAQQGRPLDENLRMYGMLRTDAFLIGGSVYAAGTPTEDYSLDDFLTRTDEQLATAMDNFVESRYPDSYLVGYDAAANRSYSYVPEEAFNGLVIMDIEGHGLVVHPDNLLDHYRSTNYEGMTGHQIVNRIMKQYGKCADITKRAFPGGHVGLFGVLRGRRNGRSSEELVRKAEFFKLKAAHSQNWLRNVDYLCPVVFSGWSPLDEVNSCSGGAPIRNCAARYEGMVDTAVRALTSGPLVTRGGPTCGGSFYNPDSGCANVEPELWTEDDPVVDVNGVAFKVCPLLSVKIFNQSSCHDDRYLAEAEVDPTLESTLGAATVDLDQYVFENASPYVDCYAYWIDQEIDRQLVRQTMTVQTFPIFGDYDSDGDVDRMDDRLFSQHFVAGHPAADLNGDGSVDAADRCIMNNLLGIACP